MMRFWAAIPRGESKLSLRNLASERKRYENDKRADSFREPGH
jgi:hypothetical protein